MTEEEIRNLVEEILNTKNYIDRATFNSRPRPASWALANNDRRTRIPEYKFLNVPLGNNVESNFQTLPRTSDTLAKFALSVDKLLGIANFRVLDDLPPVRSEGEIIYLSQDIDKALLGQLTAGSSGDGLIGFMKQGERDDNYAYGPYTEDIGSYSDDNLAFFYYDTNENYFLLKIKTEKNLNKITLIDPQGNQRNITALDFYPRDANTVDGFKYFEVDDSYRIRTDFNYAVQFSFDDGTSLYPVQNFREGYYSVDDSLQLVPIINQRNVEMTKNMIEVNPMAFIDDFLDDAHDTISAKVDTVTSVPDVLILKDMEQDGTKYKGVIVKITNQDPDKDLYCLIQVHTGQRPRILTFDEKSEIVSFLLRSYS